MGWLAAQRAHKRSRNPVKQSTEDLIARRVLNGMGYVESDLYALEEAVDKPTPDEATLWQRVKAILEISSTAYGKMFGARRLFTFYTHTLKKAKPETLFDPILLDEPPYPVILTRVGDTRDSYAFFPVVVRSNDSVLSITTLEWLKPPYSIVAEIGKWSICSQPIAHFIAQLEIDTSERGVYG